MSVLASFNYTHSYAAVVIGVASAAFLLVTLTRLGRPWIAAVVGAAGWSVIGFLVGKAGTGDMTELTAMFYAALGAIAGSLVSGVCALARYLQKRQLASDRDSR